MAPDLAEAARRWREDGWVLIEGLVDDATMAEAAGELASLEVPRPTGPTRRADEVGRPRFRAAQFDGTHLFPLPDAPTLNRLVVDPAVVEFATLAIGASDLRLYQSRLWSKYADHTDYAQPLHRDLNHSLVPSRSEPGWWHVECFLYLGDVGLDNGAPRLVPRSAMAAAGIDPPAGRAPIERDQRPDLYELEVPACGPRGSLLAYRSDVWHRGADLAPGTERHVLVVAYKPSGADWIGFDAHPPLVGNRDFVAFVEASTPAELALLGIPRPGDAYWTGDTVAGLSELYPGLDVGPWRRALGG